MSGKRGKEIFRMEKERVEVLCDVVVVDQIKGHDLWQNKNDACGIRTHAPYGNNLAGYRLNHSAKASCSYF